MPSGRDLPKYASPGSPGELRARPGRSLKPLNCLQSCCSSGAVVVPCAFLLGALVSLALVILSGASQERGHLLTERWSSVQWRTELDAMQAAGTVAEAAVGRRAASITVAAVGQGGAPTGEGSLQSGDADLAAPAKRPASPACPQAESQPKCTKCPAPAPCPTVAQARRKQAAPAIDANATMVAAAAAAAAAEAARREDLSPSLRLPWETLLSEADVQRGLSYWGTGARLRAVAAKLAAGQPIKVFTLGGSVTKGQGSHAVGAGYAERFFEFINATWPHRDHVLENKGIGGTSSGVFSACAEQMVAPDAALVVIEFTVNDKADLRLADPQRRGYEQLVRKLLRLPGAPAVVQLHHYTWWRALGDGVDYGLFYYPQAEEHYTLFSHYYDIPSISVRAALYHLMQQGIPGFKTERVWDEKKYGATPAGIKLQQASEEEREQYWYSDRTHPSDRGHQMLAELLASVMLRAAEEQQQRPSPGPSVWAVRSAEVEHRLAPLPPPMIPGNVDVPTSLCAIQEGFKPIVVDAQGFQYRAERPEEATFTGQKWGWTGVKPGNWADLLFDSRADAGAASTTVREEAEADSAEGAKGKEDEGSASRGYAGPGSAVANPMRQAEVLLTYLRSYEGMGTAQVKCISGCTCSTTYLDGTWEQKASLLQIHPFKVSQHQACLVRVKVMSREGEVPQEGHKVTLAALMVSHFPIRLDTYQGQAEQVASLT